MTTLTSKIDGVQLWAYDIARRPVKDLDTKGNPQLLSYTKANPQLDELRPVTQNPTEYLNQPINSFRYVTDINHYMYGNTFDTDDTLTKIPTHGIKWATSDNIDQQIEVHNYYSTQKYNIVIFEGDDIYIKSPSTDDTGTDTTKKQAFTTKTTGIKILDQSGIVRHSRGSGIVIFEVQSGYKIPAGTIIKANPTFEDGTQDYEEVPADPETYNVTYDMPSGIYEMTVTDYKRIDWLHCDIDFATIEDTTPTEPTEPTTATIPVVEKLEHVKSDIKSASIDRKLNAINLIADEGYTFQSSIQVLFYSGGNVVSDYNVDGNNQNTITIPLNTTKENTIMDSMDNIQLTATATLENSHAGYEHNYLITEPELSAFSNDKIWNFVGGTQVEAVYNVSQFINNLIELPFKVDIVTNVNKISVGREQSSVVSHEAKTRFVTLDLGNIEVPAKYKNGYDYQNKSIKLYTPFVSPISINSENVIDKNIHIIYKIDISNGDLTINLYNDDLLFFTGANNIASQLPFLNTIKNTIINRDNHFTDNEVRKPYIVITRETPILNNDYYPTIERGLIKNYNGNMKAHLLNNINIPNNELSQLNNLLESGVKYVKSDWCFK